MNNNQQSFEVEKKGYGNAAAIIGVLPLLFFPLLVFFYPAGIILGALAIFLGAKSLHTTSRTAGIVGITLGSVSLAYLVLLLASAFLYR